ncbi:MAG: hypothetical protein Q8O40_02765 [Chloroflexota bacterium]|nr:hypothetical protein [Chloroflexota bacterium]
MGSELGRFCELMLQRYGGPQRIGLDTATLAGEFVRRFALSSIPTLLEVRQLLDEHYKVARIEPKDITCLPSLSYQEDQEWVIEYDANQSVGRTLHSIMHELYEVIQHTFEEVVPVYRAPWHDHCLKPFADRFAAAVVMQPAVYLPALLETGLDIVAVRQVLHSPRQAPSYASVAIRMQELLRPPHFRDTVPFYLAIYERLPLKSGDNRGGRRPVADFSARYVVRSSEIRISEGFGPPRRLDLYPRRLLARRGDAPVPDFLATEVIRTRRALYVERVRFDLLGVKDLCMIARPVIWFSYVAKVIVLGVRLEHAHLLERQVMSLEDAIVYNEWSVT